MDQENRGADDAAEESIHVAAAVDDDGDDSFEAQLDASREVIEKLTTEVEALKSEKQELKDKSLRLVADMENLRRRTERDKAEFSKYAISEFARDILSVADNIRRAIEAVPQEAKGSEGVLHSLVEGVEVTEKELLKALEKYQVVRFDPKGEPFNPHKHDAMTRIEVQNVPADTVVQVIHAGYMIGERVLRPAAVIVSKEATAPAPPPEPVKIEEAEEEPIPPGAMKVPEEVENAASAGGERPAGTRNVRVDRVDVQKNVLGRDFQADRRRQGGGDDRVAQIRRPRSPAGDQSFSEVRPGSGSTSGKPSTLHKPVISRKDTPSN